MAAIIREALTVDGMELTMFTGNQSRAGISLTGTWAGTVSFFGSNDGLNFFAVTATPFASGTGVQSATANGNWWLNAVNYQAVKVKFARTSGTVTVTIAASTDASYQDAFLAASSKYVSQSVSGGTVNTLTIAAQANRAWRVKTLVVGFSVAPAAPCLVTISDGGSTTLWATYVPIGVTGGVGNFAVPLPLPDPAVPGSGGVVGTPGNSLVISVAAPGGSVVSTVSAEIGAA